MKKALTLVFSIAVVCSVFAAQSFAHGGHWHGHHGHHGKKHAQVFRGTLAPVTGATGATGATGSTSRTWKSGKSWHRHGKRSRHRARMTGPIGIAQWTQNSQKFKFVAAVKGLGASSSYTVAIYADADGQGCASTSNTPLGAPAIPALATNSRGYGWVKARGSRSDVSLDPAGDYYVKVTDSAGAAVLCGDIKLKGKRGWHSGNCGGSTGGTGPTAAVGRHKH